KSECRSQNAEVEQTTSVFLRLNSDLITFAFPLMSPLGFFQYGGEVSTAEIEPLRDVAGHRDPRAVPRHAIILAEDPHAAGTVIDFENAGAERTERTRNLPGNRDFLTRKSSGVPINVRNGG